MPWDRRAVGSTEILETFGGINLIGSFRKNDESILDRIQQVLFVLVGQSFPAQKIQGKATQQLASSSAVLLKSGIAPVVGRAGI